MTDTNGPHPMTAADLWRLRRVGHPAAARDGTVVVPVTSYYPEGDKDGITRLWELTPDGRRRPLTRPDASSTAPALSPDGRRIAFLRKHEGVAQLWTMPRDGGEPRRLTSFPKPAAAPRWTPDGRTIVVLTTLLRGFGSPDATAAEMEERAGRPDSGVRATEDRIYRHWDRWLTDGLAHHLVAVDADNGTLAVLTHDWERWMAFDLDLSVYDIGPEGEIVFRGCAVDPPYADLAWGLFTIPAAGGAPRRLPTGSSANVLRPRWSPAGQILFGVQPEWPGFYADRVRLVELDPAAGTHRHLLDALDQSPAGWEYAAPDVVVFCAEDRGRRHLFRWDYEGPPVRIAAGGWMAGPVPAGDHVVARRESLSSPPELVRVPVRGGDLEAIGGFNDDLLAGIELGATEDASVAGYGGEEVQLFLVYPPGFDKGRKWPLLHNIHGGPHGSSGDQFHFRWNSQVFAAAGYVVAAVNFHGSSGRGQEYARGIQGAWGEAPAADILAATDSLLERGFIDEDRMAIAGGSYGGYLVSWLMGVTDRFAAAICHAGVTNLLGQWATDGTYGREQAFGGTPWENIEAVERWSPTRHLQDAATPTLVIHGEKDYRVVVTQGLELYGILRAQGVAARLVYFPDEGHWILKPANSLRWYEEFLGWLERYL